MTTKKLEPRVATTRVESGLVHPAPRVAAAVIAEPRAGTASAQISDEEFVGRLNFLSISLDHEIGNALAGLLSVIQDKKHLCADLRSMSSVYRRLTNTCILLRGIAKSAYESGVANLPQTNRVALDVAFENGQYRIRNITAAKRVIYTLAQDFNDLLYAFESHIQEVSTSSIPESANITKLRNFGSMVMHKFQRLVAGEESDVELIELSIKTIRKKIGLVFSNQSIKYALATKKTEQFTDTIALTDPEFLVLIAYNIVTNARRALEQKGAELKITLSERIENGRYALEFSDAGCGMPKEIMDKLNAGEQVTTKTEAGTHGIGFQYCRELAEKMGGRLYVLESSVGVGTTIVLELRLAEEPVATK